MKKKNILLIPTTDNIITNWEDVYMYLYTQGHSIFVILDNKLIKKETPSEFIKIDSYILKLQQLEKFNYFELIVIKTYANIYIRHILRQYKIDIVIVSNDNTTLQNICINQAKKMGIKTILHQAAGILKKRVKLTILQKLKVKFKTIFFNESSSLNIGNDVDVCLIQGQKWIDYIDNKSYKIVGNEYYRTLKEKVELINQDEIKDLKNKLKVNNKKLIVFFSQPFNELEITSNDNIMKLYSDIKYLESELHKNGKYLFVFKPHPQELSYKNYNFENVIKKVDLNTLIAASDVNISVFSTMAIQSKVSDKKTIGFLPEYLSGDIINQMRIVYDSSSSDIKDIYRLIDADSVLMKNNFNDIVDLAIDTKIEIYNIIKNDLL